MQHAKLSASGSGRWIACPGSIKLSEEFPDSTNPAAEYGTAGHELAELCLKNGHIDATMYKGHTCENGIVIDDDLCEHVQVYLDFVLGQMAEMNGRLYVENKVDFSEFVPGGFGTSDAFIMASDTIHVIDLKLGRVPVFATGNSQARLYAIGALNMMGVEAVKIETVKISIVQPTADHIDEWIITTHELFQWANNVVRPNNVNTAQPLEHVLSLHVNACQ
jgi:hypothetical protein